MQNEANIEKSIFGEYCCKNFCFIEMEIERQRLCKKPMLVTNDKLKLLHYIEHIMDL